MSYEAPSAWTPPPFFEPTVNVGRDPFELMDEYEATFEIESKTDAYAVERITNRLYDSIREESQTLRDGAGNSTEMLEQFEAIREAAKHPTPGQLMVVYRARDEGFED